MFRRIWLFRDHLGNLGNLLGSFGTATWLKSIVLKALDYLLAFLGEGFPRLHRFVGMAVSMPRIYELELKSNIDEDDNQMLESIGGGSVRTPGDSSRRLRVANM
jgi:hypothetical protein